MFNVHDIHFKTDLRVYTVPAITVCNHFFWQSHNAHRHPASAITSTCPGEGGDRRSSSRDSTSLHRDLHKLQSAERHDGLQDENSIAAISLTKIECYISPYNGSMTTYSSLATRIKVIKQRDEY